METPGTETRDALFDRVVKLAARQIELSPDEISLDARFIEDLGFDSLDLVEFTMEIEDAFDVAVPDEVSQKIVTVRQAVDEVRRLTESRDRAK
jgi:acyl carrier protein